jgi:hypothetical protein
MDFKTVRSLAVTAVCSLLAMTSCSTVKVCQSPPKKVGHGPPAHAPAHGYRRKQVHGVEIVFDSKRGVYVVVGLPGHYYHEGHFYRLRETTWEVSLRPNDGWASISEESLPPGLRGKGKGGQKKAS